MAKPAPPPVDTSDTVLANLPQKRQFGRQKASSAAQIRHPGCEKASRGRRSVKLRAEVSHAADAWLVDEIKQGAPALFPKAGAVCCAN
jgi:hypothetical protein